MTPLISVVVLAYNQFQKTTLPCLNSLIPWLGDPELEFIVFDNASPDGSGDLVRNWCQNHPAAQFIQSSNNLGYAGGMNAAAQHARGQWLFLVNNDTEFAPHALEALKQVLKSAPANTAMIGPVTNAAGNGQRLYDPSKSKEDWLELGAWLNTHPTGLLLPTYRCDFFCIAIRRDAWDQLKGLDTIFGMGYFEDFDFSLRLREAGFDQAITEDVFIYHQGSATFSQSPEMKRLIKRNKQIMKQRHCDVRFVHTRKSNLTVLEKEYIKTLNSDIRLQLRSQALMLDLPKNPIKKLFWKLKCEVYIKQLIQKK